MLLPDIFSFSSLVAAFASYKFTIVPKEAATQNHIQVPLQLADFHSKTSHYPIVLWHGMGDNYNSSSIQKVEDIIRLEVPGVYIHSIYLDEDESQDQQSSFFGKVMDQITQVCEQLQNVTELSEGFNAMGFSQGGLFLRAAMEICGLKINNLVTYGSPHNGVSDLPPCKDTDWLCKRRNFFLKSQVFNPKVQNKVVQAQYFRDPYNWEQYLTKSEFLRYANNEGELYNGTYKDNLLNINKLVLVLFEDDGMVVPKESAWFGDTDASTNLILPFTETESYKNDLIGLKTLHEENKLDFLSLEGSHMKIPETHLQFIASAYF
ncbi:unnamed protein product [[Candida] boidinii]|nr:hypothetical protein BVG19_g101 [[Candida] boidinii]OWB49669.1 palmitoyl hydrolase activity protein [[Candida] boidinii]GME94070.1 unnamed protein product [[Candida] boidinii]